MKILINYDFINAVKNVNEQVNPFKVIRNRKKEWVKFNLPIFTVVDFALVRDVKKTIQCVIIQYLLLLSSESLVPLILGVDRFKEKSEKDLKILIPKLQEENVDTDYNLVKKSKLDGKKYNIIINENKIPSLVESKYILVPSYSYNGDIKDTPLLQEHVVGSNNYVLSIGRKNRKKELSLAMNNI